MELDEVRVAVVCEKQVNGLNWGIGERYEGNGGREIDIPIIYIARGRPRERGEAITQVRLQP